MTLLHLKTINKNYNDGAANEVLAVKDFDLEVQNGEIVALLGSSGCGKTSTLRMIAGFESVTSGEIIIGGDQFKILLLRDVVLQWRLKVMHYIHL